MKHSVTRRLGEQAEENRMQPKQASTAQWWNSKLQQLLEFNTTNLLPPHNPRPTSQRASASSWEYVWLAISA